MKVTIRKAKKTDSENIIKLITELAVFEKLRPPDKKAGKRLIKDAFGKKPLYYVIVAQLGKELIGYAFYFFTYSSFLARPTLYLEDIFVSKRMRGKGTGIRLFNEVVKAAKRKKCGRMEWCVLHWNKKAITFYDKLGAKPLNEWIYFRMKV